MWETGDAEGLEQFQCTASTVPSSPLENEVFKLFFQPANHGKISAISLQSCECFCVICIIAYKPPTTTTRQNHGNISVISLQSWECFCKSRCAYTTTQPGKIVGIFPQFCCSCGNMFPCVALCMHNKIMGIFPRFCCSHENISAICVMLTQPPQSGKIVGIFPHFHCMHVQTDCCG